MFDKNQGRAQASEQQKKLDRKRSANSVSAAAVYNAIIRKSNFRSHLQIFTTKHTHHRRYDCFGQYNTKYFSIIMFPQRHGTVRVHCLYHTFGCFYLFFVQVFNCARDEATIHTYQMHFKNPKNGCTIGDALRRLQ